MYFNWLLVQVSRRQLCGGKKPFMKSRKVTFFWGFLQFSRLGRSSSSPIELNRSSYACWMKMRIITQKSMLLRALELATGYKELATSIRDTDYESVGSHWDQIQPGSMRGTNRSHFECLLRTSILGCIFFCSCWCEGHKQPMKTHETPFYAAHKQIRFFSGYKVKAACFFDDEISKVKHFHR